MKTYFAKPKCPEMPASNRVHSNTIIHFCKEQNMDILESNLHAQKSVKDGYEVLLVPIMAQPSLGGFDTADIRITSRNIGVGTSDVGVWVMAKHVLVAPCQVGSAIDKVMKRAQYAPDPLILGDGAM